jgi:hypothetical protein
MLDEVYACLSRAGVQGGCNVMLYRDLPEADQAVRRWCASQGRDITG